ncbi:hypothetical protein Tco_0958977 [Tanacetum coccineum]
MRNQTIWKIAQDTGAAPKSTTTEMIPDKHNLQYRQIVKTPNRSEERKSMDIMGYNGDGCIDLRDEPLTQYLAEGAIAAPKRTYDPDFKSACLAPVRTYRRSSETRLSGGGSQSELVINTEINTVRWQILMLQGPNINTGRTNINSGRPKVNAVSSNINTVRSRQPEHPLKNMVDRGIFDSGCSGHMTGNKDQLEDFEEFNGGSVTFEGSKG